MNSTTLCRNLETINLILYVQKLQAVMYTKIKNMNQETKDTETVTIPNGYHGYTVYQTKFRFNPKRNLKYVFLLDLNNFGIFHYSFSPNLMAKLKEPYTSHFYLVCFRKLLNVLYTL